MCTYLLSVKYWRSFPYNSHIPLFVAACILSLCWKNMYVNHRNIHWTFCLNITRFNHIIMWMGTKVYKVYVVIHNANTKNGRQQTYKCPGNIFSKSRYTRLAHIHIPRRHQLGKAQILKYSTCSVLFSLNPSFAWEGRSLFLILNSSFIYFFVYIYNIYILCI